MSEHDPKHTEPEDERLRRLFVEMRREDMEQVPAFPVIEEAPRARGILRVVPAAAAAALAMLLAVWLWLPAGDTSVEETLLVEWSAPSTGFLGLDGTELADLALTEEPGIDWTDDWGDLPTDMLIYQADETFGEVRNR